MRDILRLPLSVSLICAGLLPVLVLLVAACTRIRPLATKKHEPRTMPSVAALADAGQAERMVLESEADFGGLPKELQHVHPSVDGLCREFLTWARANAAAQIAEEQQHNDAAPVAKPKCIEQELPALAGAAPPWLGVRGVRLAWGFHDAIWVLGASNKGLLPTPIYFDDKFGNGMGCPAIWTRDSLDGLRVEANWLVAIIDGDGPSEVNQDGLAIATYHQRGLVMCRLDQERLRCLELNPQYAHALARKKFPSGNASSQKRDAIPWEWVDVFRVTEQGAIVRRRAE